MRRVAVTLLLSAAAGCSASSAAGPAPGLPGWAGVTTLLDSAIAAGAAPGAVVGVSLAGTHAYYGTGRLGTDNPVRPDSSTVYDLASLTKVIGLTTAIMLAVDEGRLVVDSPIVRYVPMFGAEPTQPERRTVTLRHLLTHTSGLPAWRALYQETSTRDEAFALADTTRLVAAPGTAYTYSDLGAIVMTQAVERVMGLRIDTLLAERVFGPLRMDDTRYLPPPSWRPRIAPTENDPWRGRVLRGEVHDENASRLDGVSGHAGLFSSARDLLRFSDWVMAEWADQAGKAANCLDQFRPFPSPAPPALPALPVAMFALRQNLPPGSTRALGWDTPSATGSSAGSRFSRLSIGHTGFTGTSIWIDPERCLAVVILSNRVHPTRDNPRWGPVRGLVADRVVGALGKDLLTR
jgi:CubicO group peptidase (beta-lactamase class C family)